MSVRASAVLAGDKKWYGHVYCEKTFRRVLCQAHLLHCVQDSPKMAAMQKDISAMKDVLETSICIKFDSSLTQLEIFAAIEREIWKKYEKKQEILKKDEERRMMDRKRACELYRQRIERAGLLQCTFRVFKRGIN